MRDDPEIVEFGAHRLSLERLTYATVVLMSVLVVYDGWADLATFGGVAAVIVGPVLALTIAHLWAGAIEDAAELGRPLTAAEWRWQVRDQAHVMLAAVPPLLVLGFGWISPLDALGTIAVLLWTGVLTLIGLTAVAAYRAGLRGWTVVAAAVGGGLVGLLVISLQIVLKPH